MSEPKQIDDEIKSAVANIAEKAKKAGFRVLSPTEESEREASEHSAKEHNLLTEAGCPERQFQTQVAVSQDSRWQSAKDHLTSLVGNGFICALIGKRGTGKTQIAVETIRAAAKAGKPSKYFTAMEFFLSIKSAYRKDATQTEQEVLNTFYRPELLVLDEVQERGETQWEDRLLTHLIDKRYSDMKDTLLLSNLTEEEFKKSVGPSIVSRLVETGGIIECNWTSFRTAKK